MDDEKIIKEPRFFIPVEGVLQEVDEKTYREIYRPIWKKRKQMQRDGECLCTKDVLWLCDGICPGCSFYAPNNMVSLNSVIIDESGNKASLEETVTDFSHMPEFLMLENELIDAVHEAIYKLEPEDRKLCILLMRYSEHKAASILGVPRTTLSYQWMLVKQKLKDLLKDDYLENREEDL